MRNVSRNDEPTPTTQHPPHRFGRLGWLGYLGYTLVVAVASLDAVAIGLGVSDGGYGFAFKFTTIRLLMLIAVLVAGSAGVLFIVELARRRARPRGVWPGVIIALVLAGISLVILFLSFAAQQTI